MLGNRSTDSLWRDPTGVGVMPMITTVNPKGRASIPEPLRGRYGFGLARRSYGWIATATSFPNHSYRSVSCAGGSREAG